LGNVDYEVALWENKAKVLKLTEAYYMSAD